MGFSVPNTLPLLPAYGLPPNVIRASYALNLIQTDAFQFATSRRKVANLFTISPLPAGWRSWWQSFSIIPSPPPAETSRSCSTGLVLMSK